SRRSSTLESDRRTGTRSPSAAAAVGNGPARRAGRSALRPGIPGRSPVAANRPTGARESTYRTRTDPSLPPPLPVRRRLSPPSALVRRRRRGPGGALPVRRRSSDTSRIAGRPQGVSGGTCCGGQVLQPGAGELDPLQVRLQVGDLVVTGEPVDSVPLVSSGRELPHPVEKSFPVRVQHG